VSLVEYSHYQTKAKKKNTTVGQFEVKGYAADSSLGGAVKIQTKEPNST